MFSKVYIIAIYVNIVIKRPIREALSNVTYVTEETTKAQPVLQRCSIIRLLVVEVTSGSVPPDGNIVA